MRSACSSPRRAAAQPRFDARDFSGHWDRSSPLESFANTPGGTRANEQPGAREAPFTPAGRAAFDANKPGYGPRRAMQRNDPMGRCEPLGLVRNLVAEIVAPHATFEIVQTPTRILQIFEYRHDWREDLARRPRAAGRRRPVSEVERLLRRPIRRRRARRRVGRLRRAQLARQARLSALGEHARRGALPPRRRDTLELVITITDPEYYTEPWRSDAKRFTLNRGKARRFDEQIYCIPAEEMTYQDLVGTGNVID